MVSIHQDQIKASIRIDMLEQFATFICDILKRAYPRKACDELTRITHVYACSLQTPVEPIKISNREHKRSTISHAYFKIGRDLITRQKTKILGELSWRLPNFQAPVREPFKLSRPLLLSSNTIGLVQPRSLNQALNNRGVLKVCLGSLIHSREDSQSPLYIEILPEKRRRFQDIKQGGEVLPGKFFQALCFIRQPRL